MKDIYINSRLASINIAARRRPKNWIFSLGKPWLLLTPKRMAILAVRLGLDDQRIDSLLAAVRRHSGRPETFCRPLGLEADPYLEPADYPPALCPECDCVHQPHPQDAYQPCPQCAEKERLEQLRRPSLLELRDKELDAFARIAMREKEPSLFCDGELSPHWRINHSRRLERDWDAAVNRIRMGATYRTVAQEFDCSIGILHKKVHERDFWENN